MRYERIKSELILLYIIGPLVMLITIKKIFEFYLINLTVLRFTIPEQVGYMQNQDAVRSQIAFDLAITKKIISIFLVGLLDLVPKPLQRVSSPLPPPLE